MLFSPAMLSTKLERVGGVCRESHVHRQALARVKDLTWNPYRLLTSKNAPPSQPPPKLYPQMYEQPPIDCVVLIAAVSMADRSCNVAPAAGKNRRRQ
jgi:hypothetical protein